MEFKERIDTAAVSTPAALLQVSQLQPLLNTTYCNSMLKGSSCLESALRAETLSCNYSVFLKLMMWKILCLHESPCAFPCWLSYLFSYCVSLKVHLLNRGNLVNDFAGDFIKWHVRLCVITTKFHGIPLKLRILQHIHVRHLYVWQVMKRNSNFSTHVAKEK